MKDIKVSIALRKGSPSWEEAEACGFSTVDETLGEVFDMITKSDFVILLISDGAQVLQSLLIQLCTVMTGHKFSIPD